MNRYTFRGFEEETYFRNVFSMLTSFVYREGRTEGRTGFCYRSTVVHLWNPGSSLSHSLSSVLFHSYFPDSLILFPYPFTLSSVSPPLRCSPIESSCLPVPHSLASSPTARGLRRSTSKRRCKSFICRLSSSSSFLCHIFALLTAT